MRHLIPYLMIFFLTTSVQATEMTPPAADGALTLRSFSEPEEKTPTPMSKEESPLPESGLNEEETRVVDSIIAADRQQLTLTQQRLATLNSDGVAMATYHFAKAQAWLDMAVDNYNENDRTVVVDEAMQQALTIIDQLEQKVSREQMGMETAMIGESLRVREDLWKLTERMKADAVRFPCVEPLVARLEVQLVWSGHEQSEMGWRQSKPYLQQAEKLGRQILEEAEKCNPGPLVELVPLNECMQMQPVAQPVPPMPFPNGVHFALDSAELSEKSLKILEQVVQELTLDEVLQIELHGHTDKRGNIDYNRRLSERRVKSVRDYLLTAGITEKRILTEAHGKNRLLFSDDDVEAHARNRRVEFIYYRLEFQPIILQDSDLQIEDAE